MSNRRAAIRREERERKKIQKNKTANGDLMRAQSHGWDCGKVISACVVIDALALELNWKKEQISQFTQSLSEKSAKGNPDIIEFAVQPWKNKLEQRIKQHAPELPKMPINSVIQGIEYQHRNMAYVGCCSLMFLNLFSNFNLSSNNKGTGTLDKIINQCVIHFYDLQRNPNDYKTEKVLAKTKKITGLELV